MIKVPLRLSQVLLDQFREYGIILEGNLNRSLVQIEIPYRFGVNCDWLFAEKFNITAILIRWIQLGIRAVDASPVFKVVLTLGLVKKLIILCIVSLSIYSLLLWFSHHRILLWILANQAHRAVACRADIT